MSKWTNKQHSESGILRKSDFKEKKEELFVFGYTCKLFRDDEKALHIDQGKHLIPWMGDDTMKIDRYDGRGALHELSRFEAPSGGFDWRVELTKSELDVEQLCDEERYRALHTDEDEEEMYREEELKRLHAAGCQVGFNYENTPEPNPTGSVSIENDEPFEPTLEYKALFTDDIVMPETQKLNAIIEKTAKFIASQGIQMEILLRAKQADNPQFLFLNKDTPLNKYYTTLIGLVKNGSWPPKEKVEEIEPEKQPEEDYLHPSLGTTIIESAPSIPSIQYKPSADCDYTLLVCKLRGQVGPEAESYDEPLAPGELPPPGTEPRLPHPHIARAPVLYYQPPQVPPTPVLYQNFPPPPVHSIPPPLVHPLHSVPPPSITDVVPAKSTGLSLMQNYDSDTDSDTDSDSSTEPPKPIISIPNPPEEIKVVIDKMAAYVARNGDEFADIVRAKNDPRFTFLEPQNVYYAYYKKLMQEKRGMNGSNVKECNDGGETKVSAPVSFSIKKQKEPEPKLPKPALPYETSSEDEENKQTEEVTEEPDNNPNILVKPPTIPLSQIPPVVMYKLEAEQKFFSNTTKVQENTEPIVPKQSTVATVITERTDEKVKIKESPPKESFKKEELNPIPLADVKENIDSKEDYYNKKNDEYYQKKEKKHKERVKERSRPKSENRELKRSKKSKEGEKVKRKKYKEEFINEIISLEESDDLIDLTGDISDNRVDGDTEAEKAKQIERRKRAAEFLKKVGVDPSAASLPTTSLASAMVDTLETLKKKKDKEEDRRRRREKKRHRDKYGERNSNYSHDGSHKKSKKRHRSNESRRDDDDEYESIRKKRKKKDKKAKLEKKLKPQTLDIDLTNTLKELRSNSPTRALELMESPVHNHIEEKAETSSEEEIEIEKGKDKKLVKKAKVREYSEGEWSSDSEEDSSSIPTGSE